MSELIVSLFMLFLMGSNILIPWLYATSFIALTVTAVAVVRRVKEKKKPTRAAVVFLSLGCLFVLASAVMRLLSKFGLSLYLFGVGSSILCPIAIGLSALCLVVGALLLMKDVIRKWLIVILSVALSLCLLVFGSLLYFFNLASTYRRIDHHTVIETEDVLGHITVTEYEILFPGIMKEVRVTYGYD